MDSPQGPHQGTSDSLFQPIPSQMYCKLSKHTWGSLSSLLMKVTARSLYCGQIKPIFEVYRVLRAWVVPSTPFSFMYASVPLVFRGNMEILQWDN